MKKFILSFIMMLCCIVGSAQTYVYSVASDGYTNIRSTNSTNGRIIGELRNGGGYATLMQTSGSWYKVNYKGIVGYVHKSQVRTTSSTYSPTTSSTKYVYSVARDGYTNIRSANSTNSRIVGELRNGGGGAKYLNTSGSWYKVSYNGIVGYVHKSQVKLR